MYIYFDPQGPLDVGNFCLAQKGVVEMMLAMASCDDELQQVISFPLMCKVLI